MAVELPEGLKQELAHLIASLRRPGIAGVKWVDPASIHLTLKFLGNVAVVQLEQLGAALEEAARGIPPFRLEVTGTGVFPAPARARVAWVGLGGDLESLRRLQRQVETALGPLGFPPEGRQFSPHLTLARVRDTASPAERRRFGERVVASGFTATTPLVVDSVVLMRSQLLRSGAVYSRLSLVRLG